MGEGVGGGGGGEQGGLGELRNEMERRLGEFEKMSAQTRRGWKVG